MANDRSRDNARAKNSARHRRRAAGDRRAPTCRWLPAGARRPVRQACAAAACRPAPCRRRRWPLRGAADSIALRLRHHDRQLHATPACGPDRAGQYDAMEQARVEVVGSRLMAGVAANLARSCGGIAAEGYDRIPQGPDAGRRRCRLLAREQMSGEASPPAARRMLDMWRDTLASKGGTALAEMRPRSTTRGLCRRGPPVAPALDLDRARTPPRTRPRKASRRRRTIPPDASRRKATARASSAILGPSPRR